MSPTWPGEVVLVTGGGSGIGAAMAARAAADGARAVVVADLDEVAARRVADNLGEVGHAHHLDVADRSAVHGLVTTVEDQVGRIDTVLSNAGITTGVGVLGDDDDAVLARWDASWQVNVMAHVHLAQAVLPGMVAAGGGRFVVTASAAGLLLAPGDAPYSVTKHAAVAFSEYLSLHYGSVGVDVSVLCPLGVSTPLLMDPLAAGDPAAAAVAASGEIITPDLVAETVATGVAAGRFLLLPHPEVARYWAQKASDPERWLAGVRRLTAAPVSPPVGTGEPDV
ncbi:SDR family oxidoreductase [Jatrophihabitans sp. YIM 134969]